MTGLPRPYRRSSLNLKRPEFSGPGEEAVLSRETTTKATKAVLSVTGQITKDWQYIRGVSIVRMVSVRSVELIHPTGLAVSSVETFSTFCKYAKRGGNNMFSLETIALLVTIFSTVVGTAAIFWQIIDKKVDDKHAEAIMHIDLLSREVHRMLDNHENRIQKLEDIT